MNLHLATFEIETSLRTVEGIIRPLAAKKGLTVLTYVAPEVTTVCADEGKFKQVLYNLLSNAVKFTPAGGCVATIARLVEGMVEIVVADTGIGIAPADQERVFEKFQQIDSSVARQHQGTGLGLALVRQLVELQGGQVWLDSTPGAGSRFGFSLPVQVEPRGDQPSAHHEVLAPAKSARPGGDRPLVLVVEDDPGAQELLRTYLEQDGYRVATVAEGSRVVEQARALRPAVITLDVLLPGTDGWSVLRALKADAATTAIPVVVVSILEDSRPGHRLGAAACLVKPVAREELLWTLQRLHVSGGARSARVPSALIVDDDPAARELVAAILKPAGYTVLQARDGEHGLALASAHRPDVVLLDVTMPGLSGFDVVTRLKASAVTRDVPIVILTATELMAEERAALSGQIAALLTKDGFSCERFLTELRFLVHGAAEPTGTELCSA